MFSNEYMNFTFTDETLHLRKLLISILSKKIHSISGLLSCSVNSMMAVQESGSTKLVGESGSASGLYCTDNFGLASFL